MAVVQIAQCLKYVCWKRVHILGVDLPKEIMNFHLERPFCVSLASKLPESYKIYPSAVFY
jgi:hypothetical protein